jgi:hypothetical protein
MTDRENSSSACLRPGTELPLSNGKAVAVAALLADWLPFVANLKTTGGQTTAYVCRNC